MRDIVVFCLIFGLLPFALKKPFYGVLLFVWVSLMNPHRLTYGPAYTFPFDSVIVIVTLIGLVISKDRKHVPVTSNLVALMLFLIWATITTFFALEPDLAWKEWVLVMKTAILFLVILVSVDTKKEIQLLTAVICLSIGFYGLKGGLFTILTGGNSHVFGPEGSYIQDNNGLALALITITPLLWYMQATVQIKFIRYCFIGLGILTLVGAAGSYSRGALIGAIAMFAYLILKSKNKFQFLLILLILTPIIFSVMPQQWFDRMTSIGEYQQDSSALGRINAWQFAMNVASHSFTGGGFKCFTVKQFLIFAPDPRNFHVAHSIYFQVLGEHGYAGLILFLLFIFLSWKLAHDISKQCKNRTDLGWAANLAIACQSSIIGFAVGGAFLSLAYYDLFYDIIALPILLNKVLALSEGPLKVSSAAVMNIKPDNG